MTISKTNRNLYFHDAVVLAAEEATNSPDGSTLVWDNDVVVKYINTGDSVRAIALMDISEKNFNSQWWNVAPAILDFGQMVSVLYSAKTPVAAQRIHYTFGTGRCRLHKQRILIVDDTKLTWTCTTLNSQFMPDQILDEDYVAKDWYVFPRHMVRDYTTIGTLVNPNSFVLERVDESVR
jgi:hypothetical protein